MTLLLIGFIVAVVCSVLAVVMGFAWWQVLAIYAGSGIIGLTVAALALATAPDDARDIRGSVDSEPDPRALAASARRGDAREWK